MRAFDSGDSFYSSTFDPRTTLREVAAALRLDRNWILVAFAVPMLLFVVFSFIPKPMFESTSTLLVRFGREYVYNPESSDRGVQPMSFDRDRTLNAEVQILSSRDVITRALREIGIDKVFPSIANDAKDSPAKRMDRAAEQVDKHLKAELLKDSNVIQVSFAHPDPDIAARVVNQIVTAYLERRRAIFSNSRSSFLEAQVATYQQHLGEVEHDLSRFKHEHKVVSFDQELTLLLEQRNALELKLADAVQDTDSGRTRVQTLNKSLASVPPDIQLSQETQPVQAVDVAKQKLLDLHLKERDLTNKYFDDNPYVIDVRKQIDDAERFIREQESRPHNVVRRGRNPVRDTVESDLIRAVTDAASSTVRRAALQDRLVAVMNRIAELGALQPRMNDLKREQKLAEDGYMEYVRNLQDARVMDERDQKAKANVSIIQTGLPPVASRSYRMLIIGVGFVVSVFCALLLAFGRALMRQTFLLPEGVERSLGLPVLADIPTVR
jgi:uncharacterized protein involved in exopolysaccharide biosynthesis